jgi:hypothetical protein
MNQIATTYQVPCANVSTPSPILLASTLDDYAVSAIRVSSDDPRVCMYYGYPRRWNSVQDQILRLNRLGATGQRKNQFQAQDTPEGFALMERTARRPSRIQFIQKEVQSSVQVQSKRASDGIFTRQTRFSGEVNLPERVRMRVKYSECGGELPREFSVGGKH